MIRRLFMEKYIIIGLAAVVLIMLTVIISLAVKNKNLKFGGIKIKKGVRYTKDERIEKNNEANITFNKKDIILEVGKEYNGIDLLSNMAELKGKTVTIKDIDIDTYDYLIEDNMCWYSEEMLEEIKTTEETKSIDEFIEELKEKIHNLEKQNSYLLGKLSIYEKMEGEK
jgi:hypothetical protein